MYLIVAAGIIAVLFGVVVLLAILLYENIHHLDRLVSTTYPNLRNIRFL